MERIWGMMEKAKNWLMRFLDTMNSSKDIKTLKTLSCKLLEDALKEIRTYRENNTPPNEERVLTAEYLLQEAMEYVDGSYDMLIAGKPNASIALSRWFLEASLNLLWAVADEDKIEDRLRVIVGEALRQEACLLEGLAKLYPDKSNILESKAEEAKTAREKLDVKKPDSLYKRIEEIELPNQAPLPPLYPLYRICCAAAHPNLKVWERFSIEEESFFSKEPERKETTACFIVAASTFYLVVFAYCLSNLGDKDVLNQWWEEQVSPLLL